MKLKICMHIARFYPVVGGTEMQAQRLAEVLIDSGNEVFILTARLKNLKKYETIGKLPVYRTFAAGGGFISSICFFISSLLFLIKNRRKYDVIHVHLASSHAISAVIAAGLYRKPVIIKIGASREFGDVGTSKKTFIGRLKFLFLEKYAGLFIAPNDEIKNELLNIKIPDRKIIKIANGVDTNLFYPVDDVQKAVVKNELNLPAGKIVTFIGRLEPQKAVDRLIRAWEKISSTYTDTHLLIIGAGFQENYLKNLVKDLNLVQKITFIRNTGSVTSYLQSSYIYVLPSLAEGISNSLLEAMSSGLAVVGTNVGGTDEVIRQGLNGILVEPDNIAALEQAVLNLLNNPELARTLGKKARHTVEQNFSIRQVASQYFQTYKKIIHS